MIGGSENDSDLPELAAMSKQESVLNLGQLDDSVADFNLSPAKKPPKKLKQTKQRVFDLNADLRSYGSVINLDNTTTLDNETEIDEVKTDDHFDSFRLIRSPSPEKL